MTTFDTHLFSREALALLRRHNQLLPLVKADVIAEAVGSIPVESQLADQLLESYCQRCQLATPEALGIHLKNSGLSQSDLQWQLELPFRIQVYSEKQFGPKAEARFLAHKDQLDRVVYSLIRVKDPGLARELYLQIKGCEAAFGDLAAQFSDGPEQNTKGIVGPVPLTQAHPMLAQQLRIARPGQLIEPFHIADWWLVVQLEAYRPARFDDAMARQMSHELFQEWADQAAMAKMDKLSAAQGESAPA